MDFGVLFPFVVDHHVTLNLCTTPLLGNRLVINQYKRPFLKIDLCDHTFGTVSAQIYF